MRSLKTRLRDQRRDQEKPIPVWIFYDAITMTPDQAIEAAERAGKIPLNAVLILLPEKIEDHEAWGRHARTEYVEIERRRAEERLQQSAQVGTKPAGSTTPTRRFRP